MNCSSINHHSHLTDCYSLGNNRFLIKLQAGQGELTKVVIHVCDKYLSRISSTPLVKSILHFPLKKVASDDLYDYFETILFEKVICFCYFFELVGSNKKKKYYGAGHFFDKPITDLDDMFECACLPRNEERLVIPEWAKGAVGYQIFPDSFSRLSENDPLYTPWNKAPLKNGDILGGEIAGITAHLSYLKDLGIDFIYLNPIFSAPSSHRYDTTDFYRIDPRLGSTKDIIALVKKAHKMGIKVIFDGVFNHVGADFFAFKDVVKKQEKSRYKDWFYIEDFPLRFEYREKPNFETFGYYNQMPKLNVQNPEVRQYLLSVVKYWMKTAKIDGWRLDVADEISHDFWVEFRKTVKSINKDALIIGETWKHSHDFLNGNEWDSATNYPFYFAINKWLGTNEYKVSDFASDLAYTRGTYHIEAQKVLWNFLDSHDTARLLSKCPGLKTYLLAITVQMTLPGSPLIYYGDEVGLTGLDNIDSRRGMLWDDAQNATILNHYKKLIALRHQHKCLKTGDYRLIDTFNRFQVFIYARFDEDDEIRIIINASESIQNNPLKGIDLLTNKEVKDKIPAKTAWIVSIKK